MAKLRPFGGLKQEVLQRPQVPCTDGCEFDVDGCCREGREATENALDHKKCRFRLKSDNSYWIVIQEGFWSDSLRLFVELWSLTSDEVRIEYPCTLLRDFDCVYQCESKSPDGVRCRMAGDHKGNCTDGFQEWRG